jgi:hypothetical protein
MRRQLYNGNTLSSCCSHWSSARVMDLISDSRYPNDIDTINASRNAMVVFFHVE